MCHSLRAVGGVEPLVERTQFRGDPVEALEDGIQLAIVETFSSIHGNLS